MIGGSKMRKKKKYRNLVEKKSWKGTYICGQAG